MIDRILGFTGGSISGFVAWIVGFVNLQNVIEVLVITLIGGIGGVLGNWIGQAIIRRFSRKEKESRGKHGNPKMILILMLILTASGLSAQSYQVTWEPENQQVFIHGEITVNQLVNEFENCTVPGKDDFEVMPYMPLDTLHPVEGLYPNRMIRRIWTYGEMTVGEYIGYADTISVIIKNWYVSPIYK
jgi:hypothetical protein